MLTIHTGLYSKKANEILNSVLGQMSDGIYENFGKMSKYWLFARIETAEDGENVISIKNEMHTIYCGKCVLNGFYGLPRNDILDFFAKKIKKIIKQEMKDNNIGSGAWKRDNTEFRTVYLSYKENISIANVYYVYEHLLNRPSINNKYDMNVVNGIVGTPRSNDEIMLERKRIEISSKATAARVAANVEFENAMEALKQEFADKERKLKEILDHKHHEIDCNFQHELEALLQA